MPSFAELWEQYRVPFVWAVVLWIVLKVLEKLVVDHLAAWVRNLNWGLWLTVGVWGLAFVSAIWPIWAIWKYGFEWAAWQQYAYTPLMGAVLWMLGAAGSNALKAFLFSGIVGPLAYVATGMRGHFGFNEAMLVYSISIMPIVLIGTFWFAVSLARTPAGHAP
jgi:hypothetical protein